MLTLTLVAIGSYSELNLPAISYIKCLDVWCLTCLLFVAAALMECVIVDFLFNFHKTSAEEVVTKSMKCGNDMTQMACNMEHCTPKEKKISCSNEDNVSCEDTIAEYPRITLKMESRRKWMEIAMRIKWMSRLIFPFSFAMFNISFWYVYTMPPWIRLITSWHVIKCHHAKLKDISGHLMTSGW